MKIKHTEPHTSLLLKIAPCEATRSGKHWEVAVKNTTHNTPSHNRRSTERPADFISSALLWHIHVKRPFFGLCEILRSNGNKTKKKIIVWTVSAVELRAATATQGDKGRRKGHVYPHSGYKYSAVMMTKAACRQTEEMTKLSLTHAGTQSRAGSQCHIASLW